MSSLFLPQALRSKLFHRVPTPLVESTLAASTTRQLAAGETLLDAHQENTTVYLVLAGGLEVRLPDAPVTMGPGDCVGVRSVIDHSGVSSDIVAAGPTTVLAIERAELWRLINTSPEAARNILVMLAGRVRHDDGTVTLLDELPYEHGAPVDAQTGLRNRAWLEETFARQLARSRRQHESLALLLIELDRFGRINDEHGQLIGDAVLRRTARLLAADLRPQDLLARYSPQQFVVLLPNAGTELAAAVAERLRQAVRTVPPERLDERLPTTSVSIGIAVTHEAVTLEHLLETAAAALRRATEGGRDRVSV